MVPLGPGAPIRRFWIASALLRYSRRQPHDDRKMPVAAGFVEVAGGIAADRHLDGGVDVAGREAVARRLGAIDVDLDGRLAERGEHRQIGDALHGGQHRLDLVGGVGERLQIVAVQLDRVLALHAGYRFRDVVLQILREVEFDAGKFVLQFCQQFARSVRPCRWVPGHSLAGFSGAKNSALKNPAASVPSSGRPCCDTTASTSREAADQLAHLVDIAVALLAARWSAAAWRESTDCPPRAWAGIRAPAADRNTTVMTTSATAPIITSLRLPTAQFSTGT